MYVRRFFVMMFKSIYTILILVAAALSLCVWFLAPFIGSETWHPFDSISSRVIFISGIWFFFFGLALFIFLRRRRKEKAMTEEIAEQMDNAADDVTTAELGELRDKLKTAMAELRKSGSGRKHLNELRGM